MGQQDFRKKVTPPATKRASIRQLVTEHGDSWWAFGGQQHTRTIVSERGHEGTEAQLMGLYERGVISRIRPGDFA